jgi:hypothetical protein
MKAGRMIVAGAMVAALVSAVWVVRVASNQPSSAATPLPCAPAVSPIDAWRRGAFVFEGFVFDKRPRSFVFDGRRLTLQSYRFYVLRSWSKLASPDVELTHGWSEGTPFMRGRYRTFEHGGRYLVFAVSHDMPPSTFTTSCMPGAEGADIAAMAAQLGPPLTTFPERDRPRLTFWRPLAWSALDAIDRVKLVIDNAIGPNAAQAR